MVKKMTVEEQELKSLRHDLKMMREEYQHVAKNLAKEEEKLRKINAVLHDGPWTKVLENSQDALVTIVHILRGYRELDVKEEP